MLVHLVSTVFTSSLNVCACPFFGAAVLGPSSVAGAEWLNVTVECLTVEDPAHSSSKGRRHVYRTPASLIEGGATT